ncbi:MAG: FAD-dependent oxidoreductase [Candidatus Fimisoma sp.]|nr:FAD-dependent oxidoreductase [Bacillota bacterium]MDY4748804.1 FAD-dependent oxidoreductase [Candidatus Fimisoma sp.]
MTRILIAGGGWAGAAAAVRAAKRGADVTLAEKTDLLLGLGNVGGIMRNNGRFTAAEENINLGAGELFHITDKLAVHKNVDFPGHSHASFYDVTLTEPEVHRYLKKLGIKVRMMTRITDVIKEGEGRIKALVTHDGEKLEADAFIDATGSAGPMGNCMRYGNGCSMCVLRCPSFGPRVSITERAGLDDLMAVRQDGGRGAFSGSCKLEKKSLSKKLRKKLEKDGVAVIPLPPEMVNREKLARKVCRQYALDAFAENLVVIDTGHAKLMTPYFNLEELREIEEFKNARFADPYAGGKGNSVRYMSVGIRDGYMKAQGLENLFLAGEKSGFFVGHTEAITTGSLAGYNSVMYAEGKSMLRLPGSLAVGDLMEFSLKVMEEENCLDRRFTFAGGEYFQRMKDRGLYITDVALIRKNVEAEGLLDVYNQ